MEYQEFLFSQLFMNHVENNNTQYKELEYDIIFGEVIKHRQLFLKSKYNEYDKGEYDCIIEYLKNEVN